MLGRIAEAVGRFSARWVPSSFTIAVLLTALTFGLAIGWAGASPSQAMTAWVNGFPELLTLGMQMSLVVFLGSLLAQAPAVQRALEALAGVPKSPRGAVVLVALTSMGLAWLNWGLSLIASAVLVRFVAKRRPDTDYRLLVACAYFGLGATWHAGLSASAPLTVATPGHFLEARLGVVPLDATLFSAFNLGLTAVSVLLLTTFAFLMHPPPERTVTAPPEALAALEPAAPAAVELGQGPAGRVDAARWPMVAFGALLLAGFGITVASLGWKGLTLNLVNLLVLGLAVSLHRSPSSLLAATESSAGALAGIALQFPLYGGLYGLFKWTALTEKLGGAFVSVSSPKTFPVLVYAYSGVINYFVPSGGSKWAIEAPYLLDAAKTLGVAPASVVLAYAWGDMATDLIQPFWAIPLLSVARLQFKDVLGFLMLAFLLYVPVVAAAFVLFAP